MCVRFTCFYIVLFTSSALLVKAHYSQRFSNFSHLNVWSRQLEALVCQKQEKSEVGFYVSKGSDGCGGSLMRHPLDLNAFSGTLRCRWNVNHRLSRMFGAHFNKAMETGLVCVNTSSDKHFKLKPLPTDTSILQFYKCTKALEKNERLLKWEHG